MPCQCIYAKELQSRAIKRAPRAVEHDDKGNEQARDRGAAWAKAPELTARLTPTAIAASPAFNAATRRSLRQTAKKPLRRDAPNSKHQPQFLI